MLESNRHRLEDTVRIRPRQLGFGDADWIHPAYGRVHFNFPAPHNYGNDIFVPTVKGERFRH